MDDIELAMAMEAPFHTYILASAPYGTLYTGQTGDLPRRIWQHKRKIIDGFTAKYGVERLVWLQPFADRHEAFIRERQIKEWQRRWKIELIESRNPRWEDLGGRLHFQDYFEEFDRDWKQDFGGRLSV